MNLFLSKKLFTDDMSHPSNEKKQEEKMAVNYDNLAEQYNRYKKPDPRIAARIRYHMQSAQRVLNVGAGLGSYEPDKCEVVAIEPSREMINRGKNRPATSIQDDIDSGRWQKKVWI